MPIVCVCLCVLLRLDWSVECEGLSELCYAYYKRVLFCFCFWVFFSLHQELSEWYAVTLPIFSPVSVLIIAIFGYALSSSKHNYHADQFLIHTLHLRWIALLGDEVPSADLKPRKRRKWTKKTVYKNSSNNSNKKLVSHGLKWNATPLKGLVLNPRTMLVPC